MVFVHFPDYPWRFVALDELFLEIYHQLSQAGISPAAMTYEVDTRHARSPTVSVPSIATTLRNVSVFAPLSDSEISELADDLGLKDVRTGELIVEEGQEGNSLFVVVTGVVVLSRRIGGELRELERLNTGQCFGEMSLLTGEPRYATAKAITNVRLVEIPKAGFAPIMANNQKLHEELAHIAVLRRARTEALQQALYHESSPDAITYQVARLKRLIQDIFGR
jgi:CRP-like cAMP-binding protein